MLRLVMCDRHTTATPFETEPLKPAPPASLVCPLCIAARNDDGPTGTSTLEPRIVGRHIVDDTPMSPRVAAKLAELQRRMIEDGRMPPTNEAEIVEQMTWASRDAETLDHTPTYERGSKVSRRIRNASFGGIGPRWHG